MVPPVNIIQQQPSSAGRILAQISRHSNPAQASGTNWAPGTRPAFTPQVGKPEPWVRALSPCNFTDPSRHRESACSDSLAECWSDATCPGAFSFAASPATSHPSEDEVQNKYLSLLSLLQQVASQTVKTRPPSFSMGTFQSTPSSFSPMTAPGSTASPTGAAYPNLASRGTGFSEYGVGCWGGWGGNKIPSEESWEPQSDTALV